MGSEMRLKFWGTRGMVSSPRRDTVKYGGNTTCMQISYDNKIILVDTGFGASNLGELLLKESLQQKKDIEVHIFYTHFHWDHTQGLPFFHPIYFPTTKLKIYSPLDPNLVKNNLDILFDGSYSPFSGIDSMPSQIEFIQIEQQQNLGSFIIDFVPVDHGRELTNQVVLPTYAYRFDFDNGQSIAIVTDHEGRPSACNSSVVDFCKGVDILVHDSQYSSEEYKLHQGWGHSSIEQALDNIKASAAKFGILTHHDPARTDQQIDDFINEISKSSKYKTLKLAFADEATTYEGMKRRFRSKASSKKAS